MKKCVKFVILFILISIALTCNFNKVFARDDRIYYEPNVNRTDKGDSLGDIIKDAEEFEKKEGPTMGTQSQAGTEFKLDTDELKNMSSLLYTAAVTIGTAICLIVGLILGIKFINGSIDEQAEIKKMLKPYLIGCAVIFGAFGIWSVVINILSGV